MPLKNKKGEENIAVLCQIILICIVLPLYNRSDKCKLSAGNEKDRSVF